jgi:hypothetical protein
MADVAAVKVTSGGGVAEREWEVVSETVGVAVRLGRMRRQAGAS